MPAPARRNTPFENQVFTRYSGGMGEIFLCSIVSPFTPYPMLALVLRSIAMEQIKFLATHNCTPSQGQLFPPQPARVTITGPKAAIAFQTELPQEAEDAGGEGNGNVTQLQLFSTQKLYYIASPNCSPSTGEFGGTPGIAPFLVQVQGPGALMAISTKPLTEQDLPVESDN
jgi:hypothetical protein